MEENKKNTPQTKIYMQNIIINAIKTQLLTQEIKYIILDIFKQNYMLGPLEYSIELIELVFPFLQIQQYGASDMLELYSDKLQFRRLLSGEIYQFVNKTIQKPKKRLRSLLGSRPTIKAFQKKHSVHLIESTDQLFANLQNSQVMYITKTPCKVLFLYLDEEIKQNMLISFDKMRPFFKMHYQQLIKNKMQTVRQLQYFERYSRNYKDNIDVSNQIIFIQQGTIQVFIKRNSFSLQLQKGSIVGGEKYFNLYDEYTYKVKSARLNSYSIKFCDVVKLGQQWVKYLQQYSKKQHKLRTQYILKQQREPSQSYKLNKIILMKANCQQRSKASSSYLNDSFNLLDKMYQLQQGIVMKHQISKQFKQQLPLLQKYTTQCWQTRQKSYEKKFNPYKRLQKLNKNYKKPELKRKGFDYYIRMPKVAFTQNNSPQRSKQNTFYSKRFPQQIINKQQNKSIHTIRL